MKNESPCRSLRLLLIESDSHDALSVHAALSAMHDRGSASFELLHIIHVKRLSTALQRLSKGKIDVVLMGLSLPDNQGAAACVLLQTEAPAVPLVVLARHEDERFACKTEPEGAEEYLRKDQLDGGTLSRALCRAMDRQYVRRTLKRLEQDTCARDAREAASART